MIPLIVIEGPTASGKTALAIELARRLDTEIISADSRQVYRHMDIGTAKPSSSELEAVPHHLISIIEPSQSYNVGLFCEDAGKVVERLHSQGRIPLVCGGTGMYVAGLLKGIFPQPEIPAQIRHNIRQRMAAEGPERMYGELREADPEFAGKISPNDRQRIQRGLEIWAATGISISEHWRRQEREQIYVAYRILLDPPRKELYARINRRMEQMLAAGLADEIKRLLELGYDEHSPGLSSLGYREFLPWLRNSASLQECTSLAAQHSRNYAKRQYTWYRKHKFDLTLGSSEINISSVTELISRRFL
ncbi:MAG: tRNA (adenosine(37)-N6)-dimethylallyltransferase MiaA [Candidatus Cloacimonadota bacterium]|jgi:tRNA dimethylallyltransferase|nr:tRNA (adenosine(37)-N6)-dimethylallyltransferase MiaA [Candidatus Cloacimonadota bacterium]NMD12695.1 tRNA (adenosine(37)-N6)-dimethylallyltransferase MiaA [Candidatus Cloacimonadota bacterium]HOC95110.1 tRNA (adenosine(37)-N6)-dimethylallyltransferase MiaA [Candidatus Cloacimonadota bacterium]HQL13436.1 tRNA (adenosine(37)-N6)-dimethylallyltransferase MiaA [Candidatus Cloacimonadota bacterium]